MTDVPDDRLLEQFARNGSEEAFAALVQRHIALVHSVALRHTANPQHAEDITQAVFVILARKAGALGRRTVLPGWLYHTARLTAANLQRAETRRVHREQEAFMQSKLEESPTDNLWSELSPQLDEAMAGLGTSERDALVLRYFQNKSMAEVAKFLGLEENTAQKRVSRALEKLRKFFTKRGVDSTAAGIAENISAHSVQAVPVALAKAVTAVAVAKGAAASISTLTLIKGALKIMAWTKAKTAVVAGAIMILATGTTTVVIKHYSHHSPTRLPLTSANIASFERESNKLVNDAKMATLACLIFAGDHGNQFPANFTQLNAKHQETKLSDVDWDFVASGDKDSFTNPDTTIYFLEKEPRQSPDGKFVRIYTTVNGRVLLLTSPDEDFTTVEKQRGLLVQRTKN
jgi:RNA polymerase sigma factor (sigma-70 family)